MWKQVTRVSGNRSQSLLNSASVSSHTPILRISDLSATYHSSLIAQSKRHYSTQQQGQEVKLTETPLGNLTQNAFASSRKQSKNVEVIENTMASHVESEKYAEVLNAYLALLRNPTESTTTAPIDVIIAIEHTTDRVHLLNFLDDLLLTGAASDPNIFSTIASVLATHGTPADILDLMKKMKKSMISIPYAIFVTLINAHLARNELFSTLENIDMIAKTFGLLPNEDVLYPVIRYCFDTHVAAFNGKFNIPTDVSLSPRYANKSVEEIAARWKPLVTALNLLQKHDKRLPKFQMEKFYSKVIEGFMTVRDMASAHTLLRDCKERQLVLGANVVESLIRYHVHMNDMTSAVRLFNNTFIGNVHPSAKIIDVIIAGHLKNKELNEAITFFSRLHRFSSFNVSATSLNAFLSYFANQGDFDAMRLILSYFHTHNLPIDFGTVNNIIRALGASHDPTRIRMFLDSILALGAVPPISTYTNAVHTLSSMGAIDTALQLLDEMQRVGRPPNVVTYTTIIQGYCEQGRFMDAMHMKTTMMKNGVKPNLATYRLILKSALKMNEHMIMFYILKEMRERRFAVDMFVVHRCARLLEAQGRKNLVYMLAEMCDTSAEEILRPYTHASAFTQPTAPSTPVIEPLLEVKGATATASASTSSEDDIPLFDPKADIGAKPKRDGNDTAFSQLLKGAAKVEGAKSNKGKNAQPPSVATNSAFSNDDSIFQSSNFDLDKELLDADDWLGIDSSETLQSQNKQKVNNGILNESDLAALSGDVDLVFSSVGTGSHGRRDNVALNGWVESDDIIATELDLQENASSRRPRRRNGNAGVYQDDTGRLAGQFRGSSNNQAFSQNVIRELGETLSADMEGLRQAKNQRKKMRATQAENDDFII